MTSTRRPGYRRRRAPIHWRVAKKSVRWMRKHATFENIVMLCVLAFIAWVIISWVNVASNNISNHGWEVPSWNIFVIFKRYV